MTNLKRHMQHKRLQGLCTKIVNDAVNNAGGPNNTVTVRIMVWVSFRVIVRVWIAVYKLLEKVTKCRSVTWLKLTNVDLICRSTPLRILLCPHKYTYKNFFLIWLATYAVRLSQKDLRILVGLLTGHNTLNRHLTLLRRMDDPQYPLRKEEEDTSLHFLGSCCAIAKKWPKTRTLEHYSQVCKKKPAEGFSNLWVNTGMHTGPAGGLSARQ